MRTPKFVVGKRIGIALMFLKEDWPTMISEGRDIWTDLMSDRLETTRYETAARALTTLRQMRRSEHDVAAQVLVSERIQDETDIRKGMIRFVPARWEHQREVPWSETWVSA